MKVDIEGLAVDPVTLFDSIIEVALFYLHERAWIILGAALGASG